MTAYLKANPHIAQDKMLLVRQLAPSPAGLPLEVYCFADTTDWGDYEAIQADLFDHLLAILPQFGLRLFQQPTGSDLAHALAQPVTAQAPSPGAQAPDEQAPDEQAPDKQAPDKQAPDKQAPDAQATDADAR